MASMSYESLVDSACLEKFKLEGPLSYQKAKSAISKALKNAGVSDVEKTKTLTKEGWERLKATNPEMLLKKSTDDLIDDMKAAKIEGKLNGIKEAEAKVAEAKELKKKEKQAERLAKNKEKRAEENKAALAAIDVNDISKRLFQDMSKVPTGIPAEYAKCISAMNTMLKDKYEITNSHVRKVIYGQTYKMHIKPVLSGKAPEHVVAVSESDPESDLESDDGINGSSDVEDDDGVIEAVASISLGSKKKK